MSLIYRMFGIKTYNLYQKNKFVNQFNEFTISKKNDYIFERIKSLISFACNNSNYYKKIFAEYDFNHKKFKSLEDLNKIPILEKSHLASNIDDILIPNKFINSNFSGGSTSEPVRFYQDREYWEWGELSRRWTYSICNITHNNKLLFYGSNYDNKSPESFRGQAALFFKNQGFINAFSSNLDDLVKKIRYASYKKYKHLFGYAGALNFFAKLCVENNINFNFETVQSTGEMLLPKYRKNLEDKFGRIIFDRYGSREVSIIASTSRHSYNDFIECSFHNYIETKKNDNGENQLIVTNLNNFCFPFIRYKIGDIISEKTHSSNFYSFKELKGRDLGVLKTPKGNIISLLIFPHLFGQINEINDYQIIFVNNYLIKINIVRNNEFSDLTVNKILDIIKNKIDDTYKVEINHLSKINYEKNGKKQLVKFINS